MRSQALDNQFSLIVARNRAAGSCIVARNGDFLAWNDGDEPFITAEVPRADGYRSWNLGMAVVSGTPRGRCVVRISTARSAIPRITAARFDPGVDGRWSLRRVG
ncbi:MAG: hypothetical protein ACREH8_01545 [Opitutaceae bacterium]